MWTEAKGQRSHLGCFKTKTFKILTERQVCEARKFTERPRSEVSSFVIKKGAVPHPERRRKAATGRTAHRLQGTQQFAPLGNRALSSHAADRSHLSVVDLYMSPSDGELAQKHIQQLLLH